MIEFIIKYWLEVGFGLVCGALAWFAKRYVKLVKKEKEDHEAAIITTIKNEMNNQYDKTQKQMDQCYSKLNNKIDEFISESREADIQMHDRISKMQKDILDIEGAYFKNECRTLLKEDHIITEREFTDITIEHTAYNSLGGNHEGDALYKMVQEKHKKHLINSLEKK